MSYQPYPSGGQPVEPIRPPAPAPVLTAVKLMYAGAAVSTVSLIISLVDVGGSKAAIRKARPSLSAAAGYIAPSLLGAGAAALLASRHVTAMLWLALVLLAATFLAIRNVFGAFAVLATAAAVFAVSYFASAEVQAGFGYLAAWFLLVGAVRPVVELQRGRRRGRGRGRASSSDADQLARLTGVPGGIWVTFFAFVALCMLGIGVWLLAPPGWPA